MMEKENVEEVIIEQEEESSEPSYSKEEIEAQGLSTEEVKSLGLLKEELEEKEEESVDKEATFNIEDLDSFEKVHKLFEEDKEAFRNLPKYVKGLYHNSKGLYKQYKQEEERRKELEDASKLSKVKEHAVKTLQNKLDRLNKLLDGDDDITADDIRRLINEKAELEDKIEEAAPVKVNEEEQKKFINERMISLREDGDSLYENFEDLIKMADEVATNDPTYAHIFQVQLLNPSITTAQMAETIEKIARLNSRFGKPEEKKKDEKVSRIIKNANKAKSSASVNGGGGRRAISYDDLTPEDIIDMTAKQYSALPAKVRERLERETSLSYDPN